MIFFLFHLKIFGVHQDVATIRGAVGHYSFYITKKIASMLVIHFVAS